MLMQSHDGTIHVLPALPTAWKNGSIKGLKARGGFEVDLRWEDGRLKDLKIYSKLGGNCRIRTYQTLSIPGATKAETTSGQPNDFFEVALVKDPLISKQAKAAKPVLKPVLEYDLPTAAGRSYSFKF
jgi:alpha-L-fucosidase 2